MLCSFWDVIWSSELQPEKTGKGHVDFGILLQLRDDRHRPLVWCAAARVAVALAGQKREAVCTPLDSTHGTEGWGTYRVEYYPKEVGLRELSVLVDEKHISGSPFWVKVSPGIAVEHYDCAVSQDGFCKASAFVQSVVEGRVADPYTGEPPPYGKIKLTALAPSEKANVAITYEGNGVYTMTYTPWIISGELELHVLLDGLHIKGSPFQISVGVGDILSAFLVDGLENSHVLGVPSKFLIKGPADVLSHLSADDVLVKIEQPDGRCENALVLKKQKSSNFEATFVCRCAGTNLVHVKVGGWPIKGSPFEIVGIAGACAPLSVASGKGLTAVVVGELSEVTVTVMDSLHNRLHVGGTLLTTSLQGPQGRASGTVTTIDRQDGTYLLQFSSAQAGCNTLSVMIGGVHINGSPFKVLVGPAVLCATMCTVSRDDDLSRMSAFTPKCFTIQARDALANDLDSHSSQISVTPVGLPALVQSEMLPSGLCRVTVTPQALAGRLSLHVSFDDSPIAGSPFETLVVPGRQLESFRIVREALDVVQTAAGRMTAVAMGSAYEFDIEGDPQVAAILPLNNIVVAASSIGAPALEALSASTKGMAVVDAIVKLGHDARCFRVRCAPLRAGPQQISVSICGKEIRGSPCSLTVEGRVCPRNSRSGLAALPNTTCAGSTAKFTVQTRDQNAEKISRGGADIRVFFLIGENREPHLQMPGNVIVHDNRDGTYNVEVMFKELGNQTLAVRLGCDTDLIDSPHMISVLPGPICPARTELCGPASQQLVAFEPSTLYIKVCFRRV